MHVERRSTCSIERGRGLGRKSVALDRRIGVVARAVADIECLLGSPRNRDPHVMEVEARLLIPWVVTQQILRAQVLADACKCLVEPAIAGVKALAAGLLSQADKRVLAAQVAARAHI